MPTAPPEAANTEAAAIALTYHQRTKHRFEAYAAGPDTLDWDAQPAPFRHFTGTNTLPLALVSTLRTDNDWRLLCRPFGTPASTPATVSADAVGALLNLALGITAWKILGPDRWAVRANPSSGNLHPIEAYIVAAGIAGVVDGVHHYDPLAHALEHRATFDTDGLPEGTLLVGLSSVMWRESWKYGERAFRYCQLDCGHAIGALMFAAHALGWELRACNAATDTVVAAVLGLDRTADFPGRAATEREEPEILLQVAMAPTIAPIGISALCKTMASARWQGTASPIDRHPFYRWPIIDAVAAATRHRSTTAATRLTAPSANAPAAYADVILGRRSAQRFDGTHIMPTTQFTRILALVEDTGTDTARMQIVLVFFIQRVDGIAPGVYLLPASVQQQEALAAALPVELAPQACADMPQLMRLGTPITDTQGFRRTLRSLHCHQDIAASACFAVGMLAPLAPNVAADAASYRDLLRAAGRIGQHLYLGAEAVGLRGTGIGCYFDDPVHTSLGLTGTSYQSLYHFTVGLPLHDTRIQTEPPYPDRSPG